LFAQVIVERLNGDERRVAEIGDCAAVLPQVLDRAASGYLTWIVQAAPPAARAVLDGFAAAATDGPAPGQVPGQAAPQVTDLDPALDPGARRWLLRRGLLTADGGLGIPLLADYLRRLG
jgi:hypothetical protein